MGSLLIVASAEGEATLEKHMRLYCVGLSTYTVLYKLEHETDAVVTSVLYGIQGVYVGLASCAQRWSQGVARHIALRTHPANSTYTSI